MARIYWMKQSRQENITYLVVWGLLFLAPLLSLYVRTMSDDSATFDWTEVFIVWRKFAVYFVLFLVHNFLLAPLLIHGRRRVAYFSVVVAVLAAFALYQCNSRPSVRDHRGPKPPMEIPDRHRSSPFDERPKPFDDEPPMAPDDQRPPFDDKRPPFDELPPQLHRDAPPPIVGERDILAVVVLLLMFGANLGIKAYFRSRDDRKRLAELEHENLEQQLEYLRYQINPHFFMNTLNNIHALVDIDPEQAKETIVELSKMMRFVLYEGNKRGVPLSREMDFIRHYVALMQLRYTDKVRITLRLPDEVPDLQIPPLILITFIENAFKHGVSYQHESFIEIHVGVSDRRLHFSCRNSKAAQGSGMSETKGGIGLANIKQRLKLLFDTNYMLSVQDGADVFQVELNIPLT